MVFVGKKKTIDKIKFNLQCCRLIIIVEHELEQTECGDDSDPGRSAP